MEFAAILRDVYWNSLDGIVVTDRDTVITDVNPSYELISGYSRAELVGAKVGIVRSGVTPPEVFREMWAHLGGRGKWVGELINRRKDGTLWHSFVSITRILGNDGEVSAYVAIARDVSHRKGMEQQLRRNLQEIDAARTQADATAGRLRSILEATGEAIIMLDVRGVCVVANRLVGEVLGLPAEQVIGRSVHDLRSLARQLYAGGDVLEWEPGPGGGPPIDLRTATVESAGQRHRVFHEFSAPVQNDEGRVIGRIFVYRDVTKETEVDRMKSEFIATVSHELRTPMTSIKGSLGLVLGGIAGELAPEVRELLTIAMNNTDRLIRLINDILDISRIEAGKMEIKRTPMTPSDVVHRAMRELGAYAEQREIRVISVIPEEMPRALGDPDRLHQVLTNLLSNAIKFSEPGNPVTITGGYNAREIWIRVEDCGPGIPKEHQAAVFEKFHRLDNTPTRRTGGTGLGLAICKAIVSEHGGAIWVESEVGVGAAFTFTIPREQDSRPLDLTDQAGGRTVLVVDDDPDIVRLLTLSLEQEGFQTVGATSGEQALEIARSRKIDAITLDLLMPGMHGLEVARQLKEAPKTREIPVVIISAYCRDREQELMTMGITGVITKPIDEAKLMLTIRSLFGSRGPASRPVPLVLVVDDDPDVRRIVRVILERQGYATRAAADGQEAFRQIMEDRPDLLILDLLMPNLDGFQLVRLLRQRRWTQQIPLLVLTALDLTEGERTLLQLGPTLHLTKGPHIQEEVVARVRELLR